MKRTLVYILLAIFFAFNVTGCSLFGGGGDEETESATVSEEGDEYEKDDFEGGESAEASEDGENSDEGEGDEFADDEGSDDALSGDSGDELAGEPAGEDGFQDEEDDEYPDDEFADDGGDELADADGSSSIEDEFAAEDGTTGGDDDAVFVDEGSGQPQDIPSEPMSSNEEEDLFAKEDAGNTGSFYEPAGGGDDVAYDAPKTVSVKKMKAAAFRRAGSNVNRLYVVRDGDNMPAIGKKIYGSDRSADLYKWNGHFAGRTLKVGDKVYYSSPRAPNDPSMKTYYEDMNIGPQYYTGRKGDNIRSVAEKLLGHPRSWMEVYATNEIDSKWALPAGTQLRYWPSGATATMAEAPTPAPESPGEEEAVEAGDAGMEEEVSEVAEVEPEEVEEIASIDDPSDLGDAPGDEFDDLEEFTPPPAGGSVAPPPPPPKSAVAPPPPPSPLGAKKPFNKNKASVGAKDDSMIMGALGGLLIFAAIILLIFIRRSRAKRVNFSQTQI